MDDEILKDLDEDINDLTQGALDIVGCAKEESDPDNEWNCNECDEFNGCMKYHADAIATIAIYSAKLIKIVKILLGEEAAEKITNELKSELSRLYS